MKRNNRVTAGIKLWVAALTIFLAIIHSLVSCSGPSSPPISSTISPFPPIPADSVQKWGDWNILFKSKTTYAERTNYMNSLRDSVILYVIDFNKKNNTDHPVNLDYVFCPCDSFLYNLVANTKTGSIGSSGGLTTTPTKPPGTGASGDLVIDIFQNSLLKDNNSNIPLNSNSNSNNIYSIDSSKILAVMDTGLDSTLFKSNFQDLLWSDPSGKPTLRNFIYYYSSQKPDYYFDDDIIKHGSAVTSLTMEALRKKYNSKIYKMPRVMVLKVLDSNGVGSTYSFSCALRYAKQNNATVANASLGYYPDREVDPILRHYVELCVSGERNPLILVAAAGNLETSMRDQSLYGSVNINITNPNKLVTGKRLFYPGCFSKDFINRVVCVTGLQNKDMPCFYQNYSPEYVSVGVITNPRPSELCCSFAVSFFGKTKTIGYEGSSFATPIVSGQLMATLLMNSGISVMTAVDKVGTVPLPVLVPPTVAKKILTYSSIP